MNFVFKMLLSKYGPILAKKMYAEYKRKKVEKQNRKAAESLARQGDGWQDEVF